MRPGESLTLARIWYAPIGGGALLLTGGEIIGHFNPGSVVDLPNLAAGLAVGMLAIGAAAWVLAPSPVRAAVAWIGIAAGAAPFAWLFWIATTTARDAIWLAGMPTVLALAAAVQMVVGTACGEGRLSVSHIGPDCCCRSARCGGITAASVSTVLQQFPQMRDLIPPGAS